MSTTILRRILLQSRSFQRPVLERASASAVSLNGRKASGSNIISSALPDVFIPDITLDQYLLEKFSRWPDKIAVECGLTGKKFTYEDLVVKSRNLAKALRKKLGLKRGDIVAVLLPNVPEYPVCVLGCAHAGLPITTINPLYTPEEIKRQLEDSNAKALITLSDLKSTVEDAMKLMSRNISVFAIKMQESDDIPAGFIDFREFSDTKVNFEDTEKADPSDLVLLPYSSGTTGLPKGVELTHRNIISFLHQVQCPKFNIINETTATSQDVIPAILPWFHIYGISSVMLASMIQSSKIVSLPKFTPELFISTLEKHNPHLLFLVPPIVIFMTHHPGVKKEYLQNLRSILSGAAPLGYLDEQKLIKKIEKEITILQGYGLTETSPMVTICSMESKMKFKLNASVGEVIPNTVVKIVPVDDVHGDALGPNQPGELLVKGPQVMRGYYNKPKETSDAFVDGWLRTGDMMYYDENKMFYVTDRLKELIKVKGFQVAPAELEEIIRSHPLVNDAAVIGVPHPMDGEAPRAFVVPKSNAKLTLEELQNYVAERVTSYKKLSGGVDFVESIPKNASGKILRRQLKENYLATNSSI